MRTIQREIKFRFWDKDATYGKHMIYDYPDMGLTMDGQPVFLDWGGGVSELAGFIPMQFTGLKDKNGKEIYEGDIVTLTKNETLWQVSWHQSEARWWIWFYAVSNGFYLTQSRIDKQNVKVTGNIYENPNLLSPQDSKEDSR